MFPEDDTFKESETMNIMNAKGGVFKNENEEDGTILQEGEGTSSNVFQAQNLDAYVREYEKGDGGDMKDDQQEVTESENEEGDQEDGKGESSLIGDLFVKSLMLTPLFQSKANCAVLNLFNLTEGEKEMVPRYTSEFFNCLLNDKDIIQKFCNVYEAIFTNFAGRVVNLIRGTGEMPTNSQEYTQHNEDISMTCFKFLKDFKNLKKKKDSIEIHELENSFYKTIRKNLDKKFKGYMREDDSMEVMKTFILELYTKVVNSQFTARAEKMKLLQNTVGLVKDVTKMAMAKGYPANKPHFMLEFIEKLSEIKKVLQQFEIGGSLPVRSLFEQLGVFTKTPIPTENLALAKELVKNQRKSPKRLANRKRL